MIKEEIGNRIVDVLLNFFNKRALSSVVLYGSYAEDRENEYSDIDLLIIIEKDLSNWREKREIEVSLRRATASICPLSPRVMTVREFSSAFENFDPLVLNVLSSGKILYDTGTFEKVRDQFEQAENRNIVRTPEGYWEVAL